MIRKIIPATDPLLRSVSSPIARIDNKIKSLAQDLEDTLKVQKDPEGVGLAAPQIGKNARIFAMIHRSKIRIIINPKIVSIPQLKNSNKKKATKSVLEGCLSVPYYYGPIFRPQSLILEFSELDSSRHKEKFTGFPAQIVQHEVDHLNGKLFTDLILSQKVPLYKIDGGDWEEVDFALIGKK